MRVLLIKISSLGDVLHALPALTDAANAIPGIQFDWVVEAPFAEVPAWHPAVDRVIPVSIRRWRRSPLKALLSGEWSSFKAALKAREYDLVLDAQGLIKSGLITRMARGPKSGLDRNSAREPFASRFYDHPLAVQKGEHAIVRLRKLFALALGYAMPDTEADSGIRVVGQQSSKPTILFVHGTTWITKHWPDSYWTALAVLVNSAGYRVMLPWGSEQEQQRAEQIAEGRDAVILPKSSLTELVGQFQQVEGMICVDSGLAHLGAALKIPSVTIYGSTNPGLTGTWGENQDHVTASLECSPCLKRMCQFPPPSRGTTPGMEEIERSRKPEPRVREGVETHSNHIEPICYQELTPEKVWDHLSKSLNSST
jgi:heptosyltransferase-1